MGWDWVRLGWGMGMGMGLGEDYSESFPGGEVMQSLVTGNMNPQGKISFHPTYSFMTKLSTVY